MPDQSSVTSNSSGQRIPVTRKIGELRQQFLQLRRKNAQGGEAMARFLAGQWREYDTVSQSFGAGPLEGKSAFELGCGQRPLRLINLLARGADVRGVDLDKVVIRPRLTDFLTSLKENGAERALKTTARYLLFGRSEYRKVLEAIPGATESLLDLAQARIVRGSAADPSIWPEEPVDFVYSEDVFEHIPKSDLQDVCRMLAARLSSNGVALIRPMVFTGIRGGHNAEWYEASEGRERACPPWDHLLDNKYPSNTYLNGLWLSEYRQLLETHFEILEETIANPAEGQWAMTPELRKRLSKFPDEELFSNRVRFLLRTRRS
jgi:hypothetical protein